MDLYEKKQLQYKYIFITIVLICITAVVSSCITYYYFGENQNIFSLMGKTNVEKDSDSEETIDAIAKTLKSFRTVIDAQFKGKIDETKLLDGAIKGYVEGLDDKYSEYMTADEWEEFQAVALGDFEGIGIYVSLDKNNNVVILSTIKESPAEAARIKRKRCYC